MSKKDIEYYKELVNKLLEELAYYKELVKENIKTSDSLFKHSKLQTRTLLITNALWFSLFTAISFFAFIYFYNTEETTTTETIVEEVLNSTQTGALNNAMMNATNNSIILFNSDINAGDTINGDTTNKIYKKNKDYKDNYTKTQTISYR